MGMATIRAKGEKKSWSEQNKERVWAAVTSCLTNVPPTLLGAVAAAAAGAAAAPAGGRGEAPGSVGRFPSNSRPRARPAISTSGAPPNPGAGAGPLLPRPSPASLPSPARGVYPGARQLPGFWTVGRLNRTPGPEGRGYEAPAPQG